MAAILLLTALPQSPFTIINNIKNKKSQVALLIPGNKLAENLSVGSCSETMLSTLYDSATDFNVVKSGLNVFKSRLAKEYKDGSESFSSLATKVMANLQTTDSIKNTCLLPLKISADSRLGVDIPDTDLINVSLGEQSIFCAKNKAYLSDESAFFALDKALDSYATQIKKKKAVTTLNAQLAALQKKKAALPADKKSAKEKVDKEIRKKSLAISYAQYFSKNPVLLAQFFDTLCSRAGTMLTPNSRPPESTIAAPTMAATKTPTADKTISPIPTGTTRLSPPVITNPTTGTIITTNNKVTIKWSAVSGADSYIIGAVDKTPPNSIDLLYIDNHNSLNYDLTVVPGNTYRFWLRSRKLNYDRNNLDTYSELSEVVFTVASPIAPSPATAVASPTAIKTATAIPTASGCTSGQTERRTMWKDPIAPSGQSCQSESQTWTCTNGTWVRSTGSFTYNNCSPAGSGLMPSLSSTGPRATSMPNVTYTKVADGDWRQGNGSRAPFNFANGDRDLIVNPGDQLVFKRINFQGSMNISPVWNYYNNNTTATSVIFEDCIFSSLNINTVGKMQVTVSYSKAGYMSITPGPDSQVNINNFAVIAGAGGDAARIARNKAQYGFDSRTPVNIRDSLFRTTGLANKGDHRDVMQILGGSGVTLNNSVFDLNYGEYSGIVEGQNVSLFLEDGTNGSISNIDIVDCWMLGSGSWYLMGLQKRDWTTTTNNINLIRPKLSKGTTPLHPYDIPGFQNGYYKLTSPVYADDLSPVPLSYFGF